jgi:hypothetical protein
MRRKCKLRQSGTVVIRWRRNGPLSPHASLRTRLYGTAIPNPWGGVLIFLVHLCYYINMPVGP